MQPNKNCHDLEDIDHHYKIIKCSKTSSDSEVNERFKEKWNANKAEVLRYHPDKVTADRGKYAAAKSLRDKLQATKEVKGLGRLGLLVDTKQKSNFVLRL
jgi:curved DNA-binding protein CbpA